jgi:hypothetical protein
MTNEDSLLVYNEDKSTAKEVFAVDLKTKRFLVN